MTWHKLQKKCLEEDLHESVKKIFLHFSTNNKFVTSQISANVVGEAFTVERFNAVSNLRLQVLMLLAV
jgi:hypothetical protein